MQFDGQVIIFRRNLFSWYKWETVGFSNMLQLPKPHDITSQEIITYNLITYLIWGFHTRYDLQRSLFGNSAMSYRKLVPIFRRRILLPSSWSKFYQFSRTYCVHLLGRSSINTSNTESSMVFQNMVSYPIILHLLQVTQENHKNYISLKIVSELRSELGICWIWSIMWWCVLPQEIWYSLYTDQYAMNSWRSAVLYSDKLLNCVLFSLFTHIHRDSSISTSCDAVHIINNSKTVWYGHVILNQPLSQTINHLGYEIRNFSPTLYPSL